MEASQLFFQSDAIALFIFESMQSQPEFFPGFRRQGVDEFLHLLPHSDA
jgi:hypothetical protein